MQRLVPSLKSPMVLSLCAAMLLLGAASAVVLPFASLFALDQVRMTPVQFGVFSVAASLSGILCSLLIGQWTDSHGRREGWLVASLVAGMVAYAIYATTTSFAIVFCVAVTLAAIFNATPAQFLALARARLDVATGHDVNISMGIVRAAFSLSWALGPPVGALLLAASGFRGIFIFAIVLLGGTAAVVIFLRGSQGDHAVSAGQTVGPVLPLLADSRVLSACGALCAFSLCSNLTLVCLPVHLTRVLGEAGSTVGYLFGFAAALEVVLMLVVSVAANRVHKAWLLATASLCYALYAAGLAAAAPLAMLFPMQILNALATSIFMAVGVGYVQDLVPGRPGVATALFGGALNIGTMLHGPVFAILYGQYGTRSVFLAATGLSLLTALPSAAVAWRSRRSVVVTV